MIANCTAGGRTKCRTEPKKVERGGKVRATRSRSKPIRKNQLYKAGDPVGIKSLIADFVLSVLLPGVVAPVRLGAVEVGKSVLPSQCPGTEDTSTLLFHFRIRCKRYYRPVRWQFLGRPRGSLRQPARSFLAILSLARASALSSALQPFPFAAAHNIQMGHSLIIARSALFPTTVELICLSLPK